MTNDVGYAIYQTNDRRITFGRATKRERVRGKIRYILMAMRREIPSKRLNKGTDVMQCLFEPNDEVLGTQIALELGRGIAELIPEIVLKGMAVDRDVDDPHRINVRIHYAFADEPSSDDRFDVPLGIWGVV